MSRYTSQYTGSEIDEAIGRALPNGVIDTALADKAPAGYGLGTTASSIDSGKNLNDIWKCGFYSWGSGVSNTPFNYGLMVVLSPGAYATGRVQIAYDRVNKTIAIRWLNNTWSQWEYQNPPMAQGVEYRTTERCKGKPVYAKLLYVGSIGKGSSVTICFENDENNRTSEYIVYIEGYSFNNNRYFVPSKVSVTDARAYGVGTITLKNADTAYASDSNYVWVKYTKKTD